MTRVTTLLINNKNLVKIDRFEFNVEKRHYFPVPQIYVYVYMPDIHIYEPLIAQSFRVFVLVRRVPFWRHQLYISF